MTVGKDAIEPRPSRPQRRREGREGPGLRRGPLFVLGIAAGIALTRAVYAIDLDVFGLIGGRIETPTAQPDAGIEPAEEDLGELAARLDAVLIGPEPPVIRITEGEIVPNQFLATMLIEAGLTGGEADRTVRALEPHFDPTKSRPGDHYRVDVFEDGTLARFEYQPVPDRIYLVSRALDGNLKGDVIDIELELELAEVSGEIEHSLWLAFEASGASPALAASLTEAFQFDIDFFHETRKGDRFRFFVDKLTHRGEVVRYGQIHAAEYVGAPGSPVGTKRLYWYENPETKTKGFFDESGKAAQRAFLRSPLKFTRISSGFGYRRHPILGQRHFHGGIDYAAPIGTPVRSVADGTVSFAGLSGPNGKMVKVRHAGGYESFYLHLSKVLVRPGARVAQSTVIGKVGSTGRSTGPHLDFRLKRHGKYLDPRKTVAPRTLSVPDAERLAFARVIGPWIERLAAAPDDRSGDGGPAVVARGENALKPSQD